MLIDHNLLWTFLCVAQHETFAESASGLRITSSAVSHQMRRLQGQLGIPLFERVGRGVKLTEKGARLFDVLSRHARPIEAEIGQLIESRNRIRGLVRIAGPAPFGRVWLRPRLPTLMNSYPDLSLRVEFGTPTTLTKRLIAGDLDVCILVNHPDSPLLVMEEIFVETFVAVASPEYMRRHGQPRTADEFMSHSFIAFDEDLAMHRVWCRMALGRSALPGVRCHIGNLDEMLALAIADAGIAVLPSYFVDDAVSNHQVVVLEPDPIPGRRRNVSQARNSIWLAWRKAAARQPAIKAVCATLLKPLPGSPRRSE